MQGRGFITCFLGLIVSLAPVNFHLFAGQESIRPFHMYQCHEEYCIELSAPLAQRSFMDSIFVFGTVEFKKSKASGDQTIPPTIIRAKNGYYDPSSHRLILRGVNDGTGEVVVNLNNGKEIYF